CRRYADRCDRAHRVGAQDERSGLPAGLAGEDAAELPGAAPVIAIRVADLVPPAGQLPAGGDRTALVVAGTPGIRTGDQLVFVKVVAVAPAVVRRDGQARAGGHL